LPCDGEVIEGVASVDESAITGESAPVIREAGGDFSSVTGGTRCCPTGSWCGSPSIPGKLSRPHDRMVEGAKRKQDAERDRADHPAGALTLVFLLATVTLLPFSLHAVEAAGAGRAGHASPCWSPCWCA
jgi:K+-transporting ATPase ATPase B chain